MPIQLIDNFVLNVQKPIDNRFVVGGTSSFYATRHDIVNPYSGLRIWDLNDNQPYVYNGSTWSSEASVTTLQGTGTANYLPKFNTSNSLANSIIYESSGNIGIGTITPTGKLDVYGDIKATNGGIFYGNGSQITSINATNITTGSLALDRISFSGASTGYVLTKDSTAIAKWLSPSDITVGTASVASNVDIVSTSTNTDYSILFSSTTGNTSVRTNTTNSIKINPSTGDVGIGLSTNSSYKLYVGGWIRSTSGYYAPNGTSTSPTYTFTSQTSMGMYRVGTSTLGFSTNATTRLVISTTGITSSVPFGFPSGSATLPSITFDGDTNTGIYRSGSDILSFSVGGARSFELLRGSANDFRFYTPNNTHHVVLSVYNGTGTGGYSTITREGGGVDQEFRFVNFANLYSVDGPVSGLGAYINTSDRRLKKNIDYNFKYGLETVEQLKPVKFDYKKDSSSTHRNNLGFIAQDIIDIIPEMVNSVNGDDGEILTIQSDFLIPILVNSIKQLNDRIKDLENRG